MAPDGGDDFERFFRATLPRALAVARRIVADSTTAEDIAAEAFARAYAHWRRVRKHPAPDAWVLRVTTNLAIDHVRRRPVSVEPVDVDPSDAAATRLALAEALRQLPARQRDVTVLRYLADWPEAKVASALGISAGSVKTHLHRALARLRIEMSDEEIVNGTESR